jgi:hypothetical protein
MSAAMAFFGRWAALLGCVEPPPEEEPIAIPPGLGGFDLREVGRLPSAFQSDTPLPAAVTDVDWAELGSAPGLELVAATRTPEHPYYQYPGAIGALEVTGDGLFELRSFRIDGQRAAGLIAVAAGDVDHDWDVDLVVASSHGESQHDNTGEVDVFLQKRSQFTYHATIGDFAQTEDVVLHDVNGDGHLDVVAAAFGWEYKYNELPALTVWTNDGAANFTRTDSYPGGAYSLSVRDDVDGVPLLAIDHEFGLEVFRYEDDGLVSVASVENGWNGSVQLTDGDGDGDLDVLQVEYLSPPVLWTNDADAFGASWWAPDQDCYNGWVQCKLRVADLDLDGDEDFAVADSDDVTFYANDGTGQYALAFTLAGRAEALALGDRDGDGDIDVAVGSLTEVIVYDNTVR